MFAERAVVVDNILLAAQARSGVLQAVTPTCDKTTGDYAGGNCADRGA